MVNQIVKICVYLIGISCAGEGSNQICLVSIVQQIWLINDFEQVVKQKLPEQLGAISYGRTIT